MGAPRNHLGAEHWRTHDTRDPQAESAEGSMILNMSSIRSVLPSVGGQDQSHSVILRTPSSSSMENCQVNAQGACFVDLAPDHSLSVASQQNSSEWQNQSVKPMVLCLPYLPVMYEPCRCSFIDLCRTAARNDALCPPGAKCWKTFCHNLHGHLERWQYHKEYRKQYKIQNRRRKRTKVFANLFGSCDKRRQVGTAARANLPEVCATEFSDGTDSASRMQMQTSTSTNTDVEREMHSSKSEHHMLIMEGCEIKAPHGKVLESVPEAGQVQLVRHRSSLPIRFRKQCRRPSWILVMPGILAALAALWFGSGRDMDESSFNELVESALSDLGFKHNLSVGAVMSETGSYLCDVKGKELKINIGFLTRELTENHLEEVENAIKYVNGTTTFNNQCQQDVYKDQARDLHLQHRCPKQKLLTKTSLVEVFTTFVLHFTFVKYRANLIVPIDTCLPNHPLL